MYCILYQDGGGSNGSLGVDADKAKAHEGMNECRIPIYFISTDLKTNQNLDKNESI
jgi:hypothetical protein